MLKIHTNGIQTKDDVKRQSASEPDSDTTGMLSLSDHEFKTIMIDLQMNLVEKDDSKEVLRKESKKKY